MDKADWPKLVALLKDFQPLGDSFNAYLASAGLGKLVALFSKDPLEAFHSALESNSMDTAYEFCEKLDNQGCWRKLAQHALARGEFPMYEAALIQLK